MGLPTLTIYGLSILARTFPYLQRNELANLCLKQHERVKALRQELADLEVWTGNNAVVPSLCVCLSPVLCFSAGSFARLRRRNPSFDSAALFCYWF